MAYPTLDYLPDLTLAARNSALTATFAIAGANTVSWDRSFIVIRSDQFALLSDTYRVSLLQGAKYSVFSTSFFDPFLVQLYDEDGNAVAVSTEATYGTDVIYDFTAPYTGTYYVSAGWDQGSATANRTVTLSIHEDFRYPGREGNDFLTGSNVLAGAGNDSVVGTAGLDYLRGEDGDDVMSGGDAFDDMHGNQGNDTVSGGAGDDWVVGGKDNDLLKGEQGFDVVYGNLGNDTQEGGADNDWVRGGQGNDILSGGSGDDWLSGDRDNDTLSGGSGADIFNFFGEAGLDRVTDFSRSEGDRVKIEPGYTYSFAQTGADVVITLSGGGVLTLVGVQASSLTDGWIYVG